MRRPGRLVKKHGSHGFWCRYSADDDGSCVTTMSGGGAADVTRGDRNGSGVGTALANIGEDVSGAAGRVRARRVARRQTVQDKRRRR
jgi:hypothetical protein